MKYVVKVADRTYEVEIDDIRARPVIARVDGETFEVNPINEANPPIQTRQRETKAIEPPRQPASPGTGNKDLTAPLPGTITEIFIKPGDQIESGQRILVIEAMKMKNSIRSTRAGKIADVRVSAGQAVAHKQSLVSFE